MKSGWCWKSLPKYAIPGGTYNSVQHLLAEINSLIRALFKDQVTLETLHAKPSRKHPDNPELTELEKEHEKNYQAKINAYSKAIKEEPIISFVLDAVTKKVKLQINTEDGFKYLKLIPFLKLKLYPRWGGFTRLRLCPDWTI
ncbi:hypothetical protein SNE40_009816 [Patella caerulea]|uniref:Uncharacterized protein n=1 Tax=Patella caerulea TaxID=87958 RepID=A0AAN8JT97_PATCE